MFAHRKSSNINKERVINMDRFIDITQLSKSFGQQKVLDNIDFQLKKSEIIGLIGRVVRGNLH